MFFLWRDFFFKQWKNPFPHTSEKLFVEPLDKNWMEKLYLDIFRALFEDFAQFFDVKFEKWTLLEKPLDGGSDVKGKFVHDDVTKLLVFSLQPLVTLFSFLLEFAEFLVVELIHCDTKTKVIVCDCN